MQLYTDIPENKLNATQLIEFKNHKCPKCHSKLLLLQSLNQKVCDTCKINYGWDLKLKR